MWIFLVTEVLFFGGLFLTYTINRSAFSTAFGIGSNTLDITLGAGNTVVLIMSSLTMAMAVWSAQVGKKKLVSIFLIATLGLGTVFLGVKAVELLLVFDSLDAKKDGAEAKGGDQENADQFLFTNLGRPDSHGHGQTAHNQHNGVAGAQGDVKSIAADAESGAERAAIDGISEEHAAEEQDLGHQENPHAERGGFLLLLKRLKMSV